MRAELYLVLLWLPVIRQASTTVKYGVVEQEQPDKRKWSTQQLQQPSVDYNPNTRTAVLNINLDRTILRSGLTIGRHFRRSVNNFSVDVLRWLNNGTECPAIEKCHGRLTVEVATVIQSRRICWTRVDLTTGIQCDETISAGRRRASVLLEHIYTGCYCFRLALYHDDSIRIASQLLEQPLYLHTDVMEYDVFKWNLSLDLLATSQHDLGLFIKLHDAHTTDFRFYHIELFRHDNIDEDLMVCHETDDPINNQHLTVSFYQDDNLAVHRVVQQPQVITFHNLSYGYYCVVVIPEDDRCHPPLVDPEKTCIRYSNIVELREKTSMVLMYYETEIYQKKYFYWITGIAILMFIGSLIGFILKRKMNPILSANDFYSVVSNPFREPNDENATQSPDVPILFLYSSRSIQRLAHRIAHLKEAITKGVPNSRVLDDADIEDSAIIEGIEWFSNHLQVAGDNNIRVVIFLCAEMIRCQEWFLKSKNEADYQDGSIDRVCCYRLNQLFHHIDGNVYRQIFAIRFDDDLNVGNRRSSSCCLLTPYRSYRWPHDEIALLTDLGRPELSNHKNMCQSSY